MTVTEGGARGDTGSTLPGVSYTVRTAAKESDQLMSSVCRTSTSWRFCRTTSFLPIATISSAPAQLALGVAPASVSPQCLQGLASTITPSCTTLPSCALHCHADNGCDGEGDGGGELGDGGDEAGGNGGNDGGAAGGSSGGGEAGGGEGGSGGGAGEGGVGEGGGEGGGKDEDGAVARSIGSHCGGPLTAGKRSVLAPSTIRLPD